MEGIGVVALVLIGVAVGIVGLAYLFVKRYRGG